MPRSLLLELRCRACRPDWRDGDPDPPPRLARFERTAPGTPPPAFDLPPQELAAVLAVIGRDHPKPFTAEGRTAFPYPHLRPDGGVTWQTACAHGHNKPIQHERVGLALDAFPPGRASMRFAV
jgi:hypothetical protein